MMSDIQIVYDTSLETAAVVDLETMRALGPVMVGPDAPDQLQQFVRAMPAAVLDLGSYELTVIWADYWQQHFQPATQTPATTDQTETQPSHDPVNGSENVATAAHGAPTDEPPGAQSADTDMEAHPSPPATIVTCPTCDGAGSITYGDDGTTSRCNLCLGTGKVTIHAQTANS